MRIEEDLYLVQLVLGGVGGVGGGQGGHQGHQGQDYS